MGSTLVKLQVLSFLLVLTKILSLEFLAFKSDVTGDVTDQCDQFVVVGPILRYFNTDIVTSNKLCNFFCLRYEECHSYYVTHEHPCVFCWTNEIQNRSDVISISSNFSQPVRVKGTRLQI